MPPVRPQALQLAFVASVPSHLALNGCLSIAALVIDRRKRSSPLAPASTQHTNSTPSLSSARAGRRAPAITSISVALVLRSARTSTRADLGDLQRRKAERPSETQSRARRPAPRTRRRAGWRNPRSMTSASRSIRAPTTRHRPPRRPRRMAHAATVPSISAIPTSDVQSVQCIIRSN